MTCWSPAFLPAFSLEDLGVGFSNAASVGLLLLLSEVSGYTSASTIMPTLSTFQASQLSYYAYPNWQMPLPTTVTEPYSGGTGSHHGRGFKQVILFHPGKRQRESVNCFNHRLSLNPLSARKRMFSGSCFPGTLDLEDTYTTILEVPAHTGISHTAIVMVSKHCPGKLEIDNEVPTEPSGVFSFSLFPAIGTLVGKTAKEYKELGESDPICPIFLPFGRGDRDGGAGCWCRGALLILLKVDRLWVSRPPSEACCTPPHAKYAFAVHAAEHAIG